ncbi:VanZ family protein [Thiocystis violascens]|uniref:Putative integral membrane protein n=1 Tax=Thiocystis violascens (strain ATCC 17096 / DSM 198 / 6111) TaxID=765911 RepID=I3YEW4_THIV6|nr:VanZ family protein [Thiocystis violascens]AFL75532.1 putative integral membrane protein [Thiocystis violascens DSM 198]
MANVSESFSDVSDSAGNASLRAPLLLAAFLYTLFVVYGSFVPLEYQPMPFHEAIARFRQVPFLNLGIGSRADWVANLLLFIPLTFLWLVALACPGGRRGAIISLFAILTAALLSFSIEFTQLFFPQRTVSQNDILAETLGGIVGVALAWRYGSGLRDWLTAWTQARTASSMLEKLAFVYLFGMIGYNVLPLDLTISAVEIFHKWQEGKVNLMPFASLPADPVQLVYDLGVDVLTWVPLAFVWRFTGRRNTWQAWWITVAIAMGLELAQLFVYSRVSDITDVFTAMLGATLGAWLGAHFSSERSLGQTTTPTAVWRPFAFAITWSLILLFVFWYPFDFSLDPALVRERITFLQRLPFTIYYFGTEFRAITEVLHKTLFFVPLGALIGWGARQVDCRWSRPVFLAATLVIVMLPLIVELGQVLLPEKIPDTTDWLLACLGGMAGYAAASRLLRPEIPAVESTPVRARTKRSLVPRREASKPISKSLHFAMVVAALTIVAGSAATTSSIPYNLRELFQSENPWITAALLAICCYWTAAWPVWLSGLSPRGWLRWYRLPVGMVAYGAVIYLLLRASVPQESLFDMVGSPVLQWHDELETALRWIALALFPGAVFLLARQGVQVLIGRQAIGSEILSAALLLCISYWGIVDQAATDNLVELMARPHAFSFAMLTGWLFALFLSSALLASPTLRHRFGASVFFVAMLLGISLAILQLGLASEIHKYDQNFSALQFLLSTDRNHYADEATVWLRYVVAHLFIVAALALIQWPYWSETGWVTAVGNRK